MIILAAIPLIGLITGIFTPMHEKYSRIDKENEDQNRVQMQESISNIVLIKVWSRWNYWKKWWWKKYAHEASIRDIQASEWSNFYEWASESSICAK